MALQFKRAFPEMFKEYKRACDAGDVRIGQMHVVRRTVAPRFIINFPTKAHWRQKSSLADVRAGLVDLVRQVQALGLESIAIPPLGCGLGGLDWADVRREIQLAFEDLPEVRVVLFAPRGAPPAKDIVDRRAKPKMTPGRASIIALMNEYLKPGYASEVTLVEIQKLAYFMQLAGEPLKLEFKAHHYGPYANTLWKVLRHIEGHYTRGMGDGADKPEVSIALLDGAVAEAEKLLAGDPDVEARLTRVRRLVEGFETPHGMELLATVHWVMTREARGCHDVDAVIDGVHRWNTRKASAMTPGQIRATWRHLLDQGWTTGSTQAVH